MRFVTLLLVLVALAPEADACNRAQSPFERPEVGAAVADLVIVGEVTAVLDDRVVTVKTAATLKGTAVSGVQIRGVSLLSDAGRCGGPPVELGKKYVFLLWSPAGTLTAHHLVDSHGGVAEATAETEKKFREAVAKGHPHSPWHVKSDVATMLVRSPTPANPDDVDFFVVFRNLGAKPKVFRSTSWPRQTQTRCVLSIVNTKTEHKVGAKSVPIAQKDITDYFSKHPNKWETPIPVGDAHLMGLSRITSAKPGWGYKEELGFVFYPIELPGLHEVTAECLNVFGPGTRATTVPVKLTL